MATERIVIITRLERMPHSRNGNPRYRLHFDDATSAPTQPDAMFAYGITNPEYRDRPVRITLNGRGHVTYVEPAERDGGE